MLLTACSGPSPSPVDAGPSRIPLARFHDEPRAIVRPNVALIPSNGLEFRVEITVPVVLDGHVFSILRVEGDEAVDVPDALESWTWDERFRVATLHPKGLHKGAPYLLASLNLASNSGPLADFAHPFRVIGEDHIAPDASNLTVHGNPAPATSEPLTLSFTEPVHYTAVHKLSALCGGKPWPGQWTLHEHQQRARFDPAVPWGDCVVTVFINAGIRDLGGNELVGRPDGALMPMVPVRRPEP